MLVFVLTWLLTCSFSLGSSPNLSVPHYLPFPTQQIRTFSSAHSNSDGGHIQAIYPALLLGRVYYTFMMVFLSLLRLQLFYVFFNDSVEMTVNPVPQDKLNLTMIYC